MSIPFVLVLKIRVPAAKKEEYHALAKATDEGVMEVEPGMLHHAWDQSPDEADVFCWTEMYENSAAMMAHLGNPKLGEFLKGHAEMGGEIVSFEIFGKVTDEVKEGLKDFPVKFWTTAFGHTRQGPGEARTL